MRESKACGDGADEALRVLWARALLARVVSRSPESGQALVGKHAGGDVGNGWPAFEIAIGQDGIRRRRGTRLPRCHAIEDVSNARSPDRVTAQDARFDVRKQRTAA